MAVSVGEERFFVLTYSVPQATMGTSSFYSLGYAFVHLLPPLVNHTLLLPWHSLQGFGQLLLRLWGVWGPIDTKLRLYWYWIATPGIASEIQMAEDKDVSILLMFKR